MAKFILLNTRIFAGGADLTGVSNKVELSAEVEDKDTTNFGSGGYKECLGGIGMFTATGEGQWEATDLSKVDDDRWAALGGLGAYTVCPESANVGELAWVGYAMTGSYGLGGTVGDVAPWSSKLSGSWPLSRGLMLHPPGTARTATGNGTATLYQAATSSQYAYANLHVLSATGTTPSLTVKIQSDVDNTFASPTDQITFDAASAVGGQSKRVAGAVTDTYWRASWTISGTGPSFLFAVSLGIK